MINPINMPPEIWVNIGWRHKANTWTNFDLLTMGFYDMQLREISREPHNKPICNRNYNVTLWKLLPHRPGANV